MTGKPAHPHARPPRPDLSSLDDVALLEAVGDILYGRHWRRYLPGAMGMSESYLVALTRKKEARSLTPAMRQRLLDFCQSEPQRVIETAQEQIAVLREVARIVAERNAS